MRRSLNVLLPIALCLAHCTARPQAALGTLTLDRYMPQLVAAEAAISTLPPAAFGTALSPEMRDAIRKHSSALQKFGTLRSFVGDTDGAIAAFDTIARANGVRGAATTMTIPEGVQAEEAIRAIVEQARSKRAVLINEAHFAPMNRAFTQQLAAALREIGYTYLACEAFSWPITDAGKVVPTKASIYSGYFLRDPVFGGFVNAAMADGWKLVEYEYNLPPTPGEDQRLRNDAREQAQARNLVERIFDKDKSAKVLIHVGHGHLWKSSADDKDWPMQMGEYLHRMTGLDMLHVDQTYFFAHPDRERETPLYAALVNKFLSTQPFVLRAADGSHPVLLGMAGRVDMQVIFPRYASHDGRPDWLRELAGRSARPVPAALLPTQGRRLIKALRVGDPADAVPADIVLVEAGKPPPVLMLPPGEFRYAVEDE